MQGEAHRAYISQGYTISIREREDSELLLDLVAYPDSNKTQTNKKENGVYYVYLPCLLESALQFLPYDPKSISNSLLFVPFS